MKVMNELSELMKKWMNAWMVIPTEMTVSIWIFVLEIFLYINLCLQDKNYFYSFFSEVLNDKKKKEGLC